MDNFMMLILGFIVILAIVEFFIFLLVKLLNTGRTIIKWTKWFFFILFIVGIWFAPEEMGKTLQPIMENFQPIMKGLLEWIWEIIMAILSVSPKATYM